MSHQNLWAPWRMAYLHELDRRAKELGDAKGSTSNFLADYFQHPESDVEHHVIFRNDDGLILLNRYPYANGHLLTALGEPRPTLLEYDRDQRKAFWKLVELAIALVERALTPQGVNMGINQGNAAGAGVPQHLHAHVVPRWSADTNFITVVGQLRVMPDSLEAMAEQYRDVLPHLHT